MAVMSRSPESKRRSTEDQYFSRLLDAKAAARFAPIGILSEAEQQKEEQNEQGSQN
jgi:hypothetical protein